MHTISVRADAVLRRLTASHLSVGSFGALLAAMVAVRLLLVRAGRGFPPADAVFQYYNATHIWLFFALTCAAVAAVLRVVARIRLRQVLPLLAAGLPVMLVAPIVEPLVAGPAWRSGFYEIADIPGLWRAFVTFYADSTGAVTVGTRIEMALVIAGTAAVAGRLTRSLLRGCIAGFLTYVLLFLLGAFPSVVVILVAAVRDGVATTGPATIAAVFLSQHDLLGVALRDVGLAVHVHFIAAFAPVLATGMTVWAYRSLPGTRRMVLPGLTAAGWGLAGGTAGLWLSSATFAGLTISPFAVPAIVTLLWCAGVLGAATVLTRQDGSTPARGVIAAAGAIALAGTLQPATTLFLIAATGIWVSGVRLAGLLFPSSVAVFRVSTGIIAGTVVFVAGVAAVTPHVATVVTPGLAVWVALAGATIVAVMRLRGAGPRHRLGTAVAIFLTAVGAVPVFNIFDLWWFLLLIAVVSFWLTVMRR